MNSTDTPSTLPATSGSKAGEVASGSRHHPGSFRRDVPFGGGSEASVSPMFAPSAGGADEILAKHIVRFPEIIERARIEYAPQHVANYLINLAGAFNGFYASQTIVDKNDPQSSYYVALTKAFLATMTNGLWLLGIKVPRRM